MVDFHLKSNSQSQLFNIKPNTGINSLSLSLLRYQDWLKYKTAYHCSL